ncbi:MAG TPA: hypothetical protein VNK94_11345, partial [Gaiellaceae bacterium]|nr:hypothetical protein [Gaiellaceae bacterium]
MSRTVGVLVGAGITAAPAERPLPPADHPRGAACVGCPGVRDRTCCKTTWRPRWVWALREEKRR